MKRMWKEMTAILCAAAMGVSLAACGSTESTQSSASGENEESAGTVQEIKNVAVAFPTLYEMSGVDEVEAAINEITEAKYGIHLDLTFIAFGNYTQQVNLLLTGDEVDVTMVNYMQTYVTNGQIVDLTDYWENTSDEFHELFTDDIVEACKVDGKLYGLPKLVDYGHYFGLNIDEEIAAEYGIENLQTLTMEEIDTFLAWCSENYPDRYPLAPQGTSIISSNNGWTWDSLGDYIGVLPDCGQSTTVESLMDNEDFIECANWFRKWYQAGYVTADILSNTEAAETKVYNKQACAYFDTFGVNNVTGMIRTIVIDHWTDSGNIALSTYAINANSADKDAAWTALEILYLDKEVAPYLYNGIEGRDYVTNDDGTISYPEGMTAATAPYGQSNLYWAMPWAANALPLQQNGATFYEDLIEFNKQGTFSVANGFKFDTSAVTDEYTACLSVLDKYMATLLSGAVDVDSTLEQAREEFKAAGEDLVIAEKQRQLDEFLAGK